MIADPVRRTERKLKFGPAASQLTVACRWRAWSIAAVLCLTAVVVRAQEPFATPSYIDPFPTDVSMPVTPMLVTPAPGGAIPIAPSRVITQETSAGKVVDAPLTEQDLQALSSADAELGESRFVPRDVSSEESENVAPPPLPLSRRPAALAYQGVFYDNDFRYLNSPNLDEFFLGDAWKQIPLGDAWMVDLGGEYRLRQQNESRLRYNDLRGLSDNFLLQRTRLYTSVKYGGFARFYGEALDATSSWQDYVPRPIEVNRFDALNLFAEARVSNAGDGELWVRGGRQELLYGDQRLVSPLDWSNTRRTFDGMKAYYRSAAFDLDVFWTRPVPFAQHLPNDHNFDRSSSTQEFYGLFGTAKSLPNQTLDLFYLALGDNGPVTSNSQLFGSRWLGKHNGWLGEVAGGYQFGSLGPLDRSAGYFVLGAGREFSRLPWKPTLWIYYDWASGDSDPNDGQRNTFQQLFPLVHKYFGFCDLVARQNIQDFNMQLTATPSEKLTFLAWWHVFHLAEARDALYNAVGIPIRFDPTGAAGTDVGQELDLTLTYNFNARTSLLVGYSHFWAGDFVLATNPVGVTGDVDFTYTQLQWRF